MLTSLKKELIKRYAPILWLHEDDAFLPEDCEIMEKFAKIGKSKREMKPFKLDELGNFEDSEKYYMDIPEIDFDNFDSRFEYDGHELGPELLSVHCQKKFCNNSFLDPNSRQSLPKYYARVSTIRITYNDDEPFSRYFKIHDPGVFGDYQVIQYFFYFIFNDAWNKHIGDWDSTIELYLKEDNSRGYAILHMHHLTWMVKYSGKPQKLSKWKEEWQGIENKKKIGSIFQLGGHPFVFVAKGAHGAYPTPGFSIHGIKIVKNLIGLTDYRQIGKLCIFPNYNPITEEAIANTLGEANIETSKTHFIPWEEPIILNKQPWLKYKGLWGNKVKYLGWSGPTGPSCKSYWKMDQKRFKKALSNAINGNYSGEWAMKIFKNWHGWRNMS